jgi:hypothetical protein
MGDFSDEDPTLDKIISEIATPKDDDDTDDDYKLSDDASEGDEVKSDEEDEEIHLVSTSLVLLLSVCRLSNI